VGGGVVLIGGTNLVSGREREKKIKARLPRAPPLPCVHQLEDKRELVRGAEMAG
jgi:hypothetical protein